MQRFFRTAAAIAAAAAAVALVSNAGCGSSRKSSGTSTVTTPPVDLVFKIQSATFAAADQKPTVTFSVTDAKGAPIDLATAVATPSAQGGWTPKFVLAQMEPDGTYTNMYEATVTGKQFVSPYDGTTQNPALATATQPTYDPPPSGPFPTANLASKGGGVYTYTFSRPPTTAAAKIDLTKSFLVGMYGQRVVNGAEQPASDTFAFVPATGQPGQRTQIIDEAACDRCHNAPRLMAHDNRVGIQLCLACHAGDQNELTPTAVVPAYQDPESGNDIDFRVMIHKIHTGASLPPAQPGGAPFFIVGFNPTGAVPIPADSVSDWSDVAFPPTVRYCQQCHQGSTTVAPQLDAWKTQASAKPCLACHIDVKFDGSAPVACQLGVHDFATPCNHAVSGTSITSDCASCHAAGSPALGPDQVHVPAWQTANQRFKYVIAAATLGSDRKVTVQFSVVDPSNGNKPWIINGTSADAPFTAPSGNSSLNVRFGWPTTEYTNDGSNVAYGQPDTVNALTKATPVAGQTGVFQAVSNVAVPAAVPDSDVTVAIDGHPYLNGERMPVTSAVSPLGAQRRTVVDVARCDACHGLLSAHGSNRNGTTAVCVVCHNPNATDKAQRLATPTSNPPFAGVPGETSIDFKVLIHAVHAAAIRTGTYEVYGFGHSVNDFPSPYPGQVGNCALCHVGTSYALPLASNVLSPTLDTGTDPISSADNVRAPSAAYAVCTSCHDYVKFDGTGGADCQLGVQETSDCEHPNGVTATTDCAACHTSGQVGVGTIHPIAQPQ